MRFVFPSVNISFCGLYQFHCHAHVAHTFLFCAECVYLIASAIMARVAVAATKAVESFFIS